MAVYVCVWVGHLTVLCCCYYCFTFFILFKYFHPCKIVSHLHTKNLAISKSSEIFIFSLFVWLIAVAAQVATERFLISTLIVALMWPTLNSGHCEFHMQQQEQQQGSTIVAVRSVLAGWQ